MITKISLLMRTFMIYYLSNFQLYNAVLLTVVTMVYITSPVLIYLITKRLYLCTSDLSNIQIFLYEILHYRAMLPRY